MELTRQPGVLSRPDAAAPPEVALLFPGQGSQHGQMATGLYDHDAVFTTAMDEVFAALDGDGPRLRADWLTADPADPIEDITRSQPLLFGVGYALSQMVLSWGVRPAALLGHSVGELIAAAVADVFTVGDAARLVWGRVASLARAPRGGMLAVAAAEHELLPYLDGTSVAVAAVNTPGQTVVSGFDDALRALQEALRRDRFRCRPVPSRVGLHHPALAPFAGRAEQVFAAIQTRPARLPVYSCYTAAPLSADQATDPSFWVRQPLITVRFWAALDALLGQRESPLAPGLLLVEAGPGRMLTTVARRHPAVRRGHCASAPLLPPRYEGALADRRSVSDLRDLLRRPALAKA